MPRESAATTGRREEKNNGQAGERVPGYGRRDRWQNLTGRIRFNEWDVALVNSHLTIEYMHILFEVQ